MRTFLIILSLVTLTACAHTKTNVTFFSKEEVVQINEYLLKPCDDLVKLNIEMDSQTAIIDFIAQNSSIYSECAKKHKGASELLQKALNYQLGVK
ncbi:MAG TPA: hypothetical protein V6C58_16875 [Allocoleopsis sp.]